MFFQTSEFKHKARQTWTEKYDAPTAMASPKVRSKQAKSARISSLEKCIMSMLDDKCITYRHHYFIKNNNISHDFDFAIFDVHDNLIVLIDADGIYYHAYTSDANGKYVNDYYDSLRTLCIPENVKFTVIFEKHVSDGFNEFLNILNLNYDEYVTHIFSWCKKIGFPYYNYSASSLNLSYNQLCDFNTFYPKTSIGERIIRHFHKSILHSYRKSSLSLYDAYHNDELLMKVIKNRFIYVNNLEPARILEGFNISKLAPKVSIFKPTKAKILVQKYLSEYHEIFDPFSGFSCRMLGVCASGKKYIGQDINQQIVSESNEIIEFLNLNAIVTQKDILESYGKYECLFTYPPYLDKEIYSNESVFKTCDEWIDECLSRFKCNAYLFVVDNTEKYKNYIVEEIKYKTHLEHTYEYVILIDKAH